MATVEWKVAKLNQLGFVGRGKSRHRPRNAAFLYGGRYPFFQTGDIKAANFYLTEYTQTYSEEGLAQSKLWKPGTLCITIAANIAENAILGIEGCFPDSVVGFVATPDKADVRFIKYCMDTLKLRMQGVSQGAAQDNLSVEKLLTFDFFVPPLPVQRRIADVLSAYDELMENCQRRIRILEAMVRALYREWFVHFRFPSHEKIPRVDSSLGQVPQGWSGRFGDVAFIVREGINPFQFPDEEFEHYSIPAFDNGRHPGIELGASILSGKYCIDATSVLLSKLNPSIPRIWLPQPNGQRRAITSTEFLVLRPEAGVTREFIYAKCCSDEFAGQFASLAIGTSNSHQRVKPENLVALPSTIPERSLIRHFTSIVSPMLAAGQLLREKIRNLRRTRDLLLPRLLSGQVCLNVSAGEDEAELTPPTLHPAHSRSNVQLGNEEQEDEPALRAAEEAPPYRVESADHGLPPPAGPANEAAVPIDQIDRTEVLQVIRQVFSEGSPREREAAIRDVARALGYRRTGPRIQEILHTDLMTAVRRCILENQNGALRLCARSITDYDRNFLKQQFLAAIGRTWIHRETAIRDFCRWLGFARTGPIIEDTARSLINGLLREGRLEGNGVDLIRRR